MIESPLQRGLYLSETGVKFFQLLSSEVQIPGQMTVEECIADAEAEAEDDE